MPVYEFYCADCHMIFRFLSRKINTETRPPCPACDKSELERQISLFAISKGREEPVDDMDIDIDESKLEKAMEGLAREAEGMDEDDPRQAARLMRKLYDATGLKMGPGMEEAMQRMHDGEDPEAIEKEMGDLLEEEGLFAGKKGIGLKSIKQAFLPPAVDENLYDM